MSEVRVRVRAMRDGKHESSNMDYEEDEAYDVGVGLARELLATGNFVALEPMPAKKDKDK